MSSPAGSMLKDVSIDLEAGDAKEEFPAELADPKTSIGIIRKLTPKISKKAEQKLPPRIRKDIRPRKGRVFDFDKSQVLEICAHHKEYTYGGTTLKGLARFDDCRIYGVSDEAENSLIELEIDRLIAAIRIEGPFLFQGEGVFSSTKDEVFADVSHVADQIRVNFEIIKHDNTMHVLEHCPDLMESAVEDFKTARRKLFARYKQDKVHVQGCQPKFLDPPERNTKAYFALVDYVTASIGRLLFRTATSKYWEKHLLSILAQWSTKLKVLSHNAPHYAAQSLDHGEEFLIQLVAGMESRQLMLVKIRKAADATEHKDVDALNQETDISARYYQEKTYLRRSIERLLKNTLDALLNPEDNSDAAAAFEMCTLIYRTGLDGLPTTLSNSREGNISASSDAVRVNCSYTAMELLIKNTKAVATDEPPTDRSTVEDDVTIIDWEWPEQTAEDGTKRAKMRLSHMSDVISLLTPLGLTSTYSSVRIDELMTLASSGTEEDDPIIQFEPPPREFEAHFTISTAKHIRKQNDPVVARYHDPDICSVSASSSRLGFRARDKMYRTILGQSPEGKTAKDRVEKLTVAYERDQSRMGTWEISEDAITIKCRPYVIGVILLAALITVGGMVVPFAVGTRIRGVDPFQITTFAWILAGFLVILAKSRFVNEWPWHDFLRGRVVCRSIKDVCDVTGMDSQLILMNLLHEERENNLNTKGPYNGMFGRKHDTANGFAIDEPVQLLTMLASGLVVLKVLNEKGEHLICLDVRKGVEGVGTLRLTDDTFLASMEIGKNELENALDDRSSRSDGKARSAFKKLVKVKPERIIKLSESTFRYNKVLGLYVRDSKFG